MTTLDATIKEDCSQHYKWEPKYISWPITVKGDAVYLQPLVIHAGI